MPKIRLDRYRDREGRGEHRPVELNIAASLERLREKLSHARVRPQASNSPATAEMSPRTQILEQDLADDAHSSSAQRRSNGHLALPGHPACQQHDRNVDAGDKQNKEHSGRHDPQRLALFLAGDAQAQRHHAGSTALVGVGMALTDIGENVIHVGLCLLDAQARLHASDHLQPVVTTRGEQLLGQPQRRVDKIRGA